MIQISAQSFLEAGKILKRLPFAKSSLPVLSHVELRANGESATLTVTDLNLRLEVQVRLAAPLSKAATMLIPHDAFRNAMKADKNSDISFTLGKLGELHNLHLSTRCDGIVIHANYPTLSADEFSSRPMIEGPSTLLPAKTFEQLAHVSAAASTDVSREVLNGVSFSPEDGGLLIATDGKRLAGIPATVPRSAEFVLPNAAVKVLAHRHFIGQASTVTISGKGEKQLVCFHTKNAILISKTIEGRFPKWKQVVPRESLASAMLAEKERKSLRSWLESLKGPDNSITLRSHKLGVLEVIHAQKGMPLATVEVPIEAEGEVPPIQLEPKFLATALSMGDTLCFTDSMSPLVTRNKEGAFCVVMPMRLTVLPEVETKAEEKTPLAAAA
ncbi:MAG: hypothetical protein ACSHYB_08530 [Roseibacillus sp.]